MDSFRRKLGPRRADHRVRDGSDSDGVGRFFGAADFDKGPLSEAQLQAAAKEDLKFLLACVSDKRTHDEAERPDYL